MRKKWTVLSLRTVAALLGILFILTAGFTTVAAQGALGESGEPVVRFILFYGETCPHCHDVMDEFLPDVYEKYGDQVEHEYIEVWSEVDNYLVLLGLETKLGVPQENQGSVPALVIGDHVLIGSLEIREGLEALIDEYLAQGGVDFPSLEDLPSVELPTPTPSVQILVFFDPNSPAFEDLNSFIVALGQQYGGGLEAAGVDITVPDNASRLAELNASLGVGEQAAGTPEILIGRQLLVGMEAIEAQLPGLVDNYLAQGGLSIPPWEELVGSGPSATSAPESEGTEEAPAPIYVAYFEQAGCQECARTAYDLNVVQDRYPQVVVESFSIEDEESKRLNEWLCDRAGVPEEQRLSTPMIFVGEDVLIGADAHLQNLLVAVDKYATTGAERTWEAFDPDAADESIVGRFKSFGVLTVMGAGLIDGLNPCAFATLVFFVSYMALTGRRGRDILLVGLAFTLGVFFTYLLVGIGFLKIVQSLSFFTALGKWVYLLTAVLCAVLAVFTFRDYFRARKGKATEMTLRLPLNLRRRINKVIRENAQTRAFVLMAFVTGFVVSLIELACTGQVYLPTIVYVMSRPELATQAFLYLVLYCLMFVLPLIVVFLLSYFGATSEQLGQVVNRHTATIKLLTGLLFIGLALWMTWSLAPLFGVQTPWNWVLMGGVVIVVLVGIGVAEVVGRRAPQKPAKRRGRSRA
jgi:cytochrome c biogenesis protein CcdA